DVALGSLTAAPPGSPKTSIPTRMGAPVVFLQGKKVARSPPLITPGTDQRWKDGCPRSVGGGELIWACTAVATASTVTIATRTDFMIHLLGVICAGQFAAFCFSFAMMVSCHAKVGGSLHPSAT